MPPLGPDDEERSVTLPDAAARRLSNQLGRAFRGTYGASIGFETVVRSVARQMVGAGCSRAAVAKTIEGCVLNHPERLIAKADNVAAEERRSRLLVALTRQCVSEVSVDGL